MVDEVDSLVDKAVNYVLERLTPAIMAKGVS